MKKLIIVLGLLIGCSLNAFGAECKYTCVEPYNMNNKFSSFFSSVFGLNYTKSKISEAVLEKSINKNVKGNKLNVTINSYSAKDLSNGIFKSANVSGKNLSIDGIYLSSIELQTLCEFNYIEYNTKGNLKFKEDFPMSFDIQMSNDDLNKTMQSEKYKNVINNFNKKSFAGIKVSSTEASIRGNKFYYTIGISIPFMKVQKLALSADLSVKDGQINFENTRLTSNSFNFDLRKVNSIMQYLNPLDFSVNILDNKNARIFIRNVAIKNNVINAEGVVIVPKD